MPVTRRFVSKAKRKVLVQFDLSDGIALFTTADTEDTEGAQRVEIFSLCPLCVLCVSVVNSSFILTQDQIESLLKERRPLKTVLLNSASV
jgi:hypothetical protein